MNADKRRCWFSIGVHRRSSAAIAFVLVSAVTVLRGQPGRLEPGNLLRNGSFEEGPDPGSLTVLEAGSTVIPGWKVTRASIDYVGSYWPASQGTRSIDMDGSPGAGAIQTSFPTMPGRRYRVSFDLSGNSQGGPAVKKLRVKVAGEAHDFSFDTAGRTSGSAWTSESFRFVARETNTVLEFASLDDPDNYYGPILDNVAVAPDSGGAVTSRTISGEWLDAIGQTHTVQQSGTALTWSASISAGVLQGNMNGRYFEVIWQPNPNINFTGVAFDRIHGTVSLDGLTMQIREYRSGELVGESVLVRLSTSAREKPDRVWIQVEKPSTLAGQPIRAQVVVKTKNGIAVAADRDYQVDLRVDNEQAKPGLLSTSHLVVPKGRPSAPFTITADRPGETKVSAVSNPPLAATPRSVYACGSDVIRSVEMSSGENRGPADRTPIGFTLKLTDGNGHLTTDLKTNTVSIQRKGVGTVDLDSVQFPGDQCIAELTIESAEPGSATVLANYGKQSAANLDFFFSLPLSVLLFALVAAGGLGGELIRLSAEYTRRRRWGKHRVAVDASAAILAGVAVFLAYYYGLLQIAPKLTGGLGLGFLLGLVGGYLGPAAMNRISGLALPEEKDTAKGKSADTSK